MKPLAAVRIVCVAIVGFGCTTSDATTEQDGGAEVRDARASADPPGSDAPGVTAGDVEEPTSVGPPVGHPLAGVDRDAGVSTELSDGSVLWLFGDTGSYNPDWSLSFFEIGSAAWAPASAPTQTQDFSVGARAVPLAEPTPDFPTCPPEAPSAGMWPLSAVTQPLESRDRVVVWMANICLGSNRTAVDQGISVGEWHYDPDVPPLNQQIEIEIINQRLFGPSEQAFGEAATATGEGGAFVYSCEDPADPSQDSEAGPCHVARVELDSAAEPGAYERFDGENWKAGAEPAPIELVDGVGRIGKPTGPFSVAPDPGGNGYLMVYSPWPAFVPVLAIRAAAQAQGPFGEATLVDLPGCGGELQGTRRSCYAANVQPFLSDGDLFGVGWYDQQVVAGLPDGAFNVSRVPLSVVPQPE